jgi:hypothetical protein
MSHNYVAIKIAYTKPTLPKIKKFVTKGVGAGAAQRLLNDQ